MKSRIHRAAMIAATLLAAATASGASDYLLQLDDIKGESNVAPAGVEVQSFSWGASNPTAVGSSGMSAGKATAVTAAPAAVKAPRDVATGQASGRRVAAGDVTGDGVAAVTLAPSAVGQVRSFTVMVRESPTKASTGLARACATGKHFPKAILSGRGQSVALEDVAVTACAPDGEMRKYELTGHVTLIK